MSIRPVSTPKRDIIAIGGSAGALHPICEILAGLPSNLPVTVLVVMHRPVSAASSLPQILSRNTGWDVLVAGNREPLRRATCIHLLSDGFYRGHNIDALFCSLARHVGHRTIGIILSGMRKDGAMGLKAIKDAGGAVLIQSPSGAEFPEMPQAALASVGLADFVGPADALAAEILRLVYADRTVSDARNAAASTPAQ
jgi:two-component system, chemotaxis family, protein-glutamate methylesterase/glutaminase